MPKRIFRWVTPFACQKFSSWVYYTWPVWPVIDGYRRLGTGLRGYRILGFELDYDETGGTGKGGSNGD